MHLGEKENQSNLYNEKNGITSPIHQFDYSITTMSKLNSTFSGNEKVDNNLSKAMVVLSRKQDIKHAADISYRLKILVKNLNREKNLVFNSVAE